MIVFSIQEDHKATLYAKKICKDIEALKIPHEKSDISDYVTISMGRKAEYGGQKIFLSCSMQL